MQLKSALALLAAAAQLASAVAVNDARPIESQSSQNRLIKTSEEDPGRWVSEDEKAELVKGGQRANFVDITDIQDEDILTGFSTPDSASTLEARQTSYPGTLSHVAEANALIARIPNTGPQNWLRTLTDYHNRHYRSTYGTQAATWLLNTVRSIASANPAITVETFGHSFNQPSVIARIPGSRAAKIIVGAHFDSTAGSTTARAPGADDNGSASVNLLEALRILADARYRPQNTIEFHWYGGEEGGLLGSQDVFRAYRSQGASVRAFLNQDMTGYSPGGRPTVYVDYVDTGLTNYVKLVARQFSGLTVVESRCGYGCSDHASARAAGFPAAFLASEPLATSNPNIHTSRDTYATINWESMRRHSAMTVGFLVEASYL
ncbi:leucyl aminopeptidase [Sodiomyces alkalinus F11]|uniref:Peptide hydrolase n=1 Tax=Sodiomyces alkalinus (strain CBS 110278 / VKM F-3762 / F11) TaxID=1314773 RepID=A0A3N2Q3V5_SODAK|nr:leucyl aminopeptidase [Sodiomyces alkalinus F11]ROT41315.1 leucyl aminopeptidase [Sodiomyces alkalinus F11]